MHLLIRSVYSSKFILFIYAKFASIEDVTQELVGKFVIVKVVFEKKEIRSGKVTHFYRMLKIIISVNDLLLRIICAQNRLQYRLTMLI